MSGEKSFSEYERTIFANVENHGCHITYVLGTNDEPDFVGFAYSVGFSKTLSQGEVITFGLPMKVMQFMMNETFRQCRDGMVLEDGLRISGLLEGFDVTARQVWPENIEREYFNSAIWFHRGEFGRNLEVAYQLVWPGAVDGLFPWDDGCAQSVIDLQPALYNARSIH